MNIALFSGGSGSESVISSIIKKFPDTKITNFINCFDDGKSTGFLRSYYGILGPSDIRKVHYIHIKVSNPLLAKKLRKAYETRITIAKLIEEVESNPKVWPDCVVHEVRLLKQDKEIQNYKEELPPMNLVYARLIKEHGVDSAINVIKQEFNIPYDITVVGHPKNSQADLLTGTTKCGKYFIF